MSPSRFYWTLRRVAACTPWMHTLRKVFNLGAFLSPVPLLSVLPVYLSLLFFCVVALHPKYTPLAALTFTIYSYNERDEQLLWIARLSALDFRCLFWYRLAQTINIGPAGPTRNLSRIKHFFLRIFWRHDFKGKDVHAWLLLLKILRYAHHDKISSNPVVELFAFNKLKGGGNIFLDETKNVWYWECFWSIKTFF